LSIAPGIPLQQPLIANLLACPPPQSLRWGTVKEGGTPYRRSSVRRTAETGARCATGAVKGFCEHGGDCIPEAVLGYDAKDLDHFPEERKSLMANRIRRYYEEL
jgi:hypothetical protein